MKATEVTVGLAESNGSLLPGIWRDSLHVTCGLTVCTPGSAPGPMLGNEYGKTLPFTFLVCSRTLLTRLSTSGDNDHNMHAGGNILNTYCELGNGPTTIAIRARFEHDTTSYEELCAFEQYYEHVNSFALL